MFPFDDVIMVLVNTSEDNYGHQKTSHLQNLFYLNGCIDSTKYPL